MTARISILIITFLLSKVTFGQLNYGLAVGATISTVSDRGTSYDTYSSYPDLQAGVLLDVPVYKNISLNTSLLYSRKGYKYGLRLDPTSSPFAQGDISLNYLELPVLLTYRHKLNRNSSVLVGAGLLASKGLSGEEHSYTYLRFGPYQESTKIYFDHEE